MAEYTLTLDETKALFTPEQQQVYEACLAFTGDKVLDDSIRFAFDSKYRNYEISNGTPQGFLEDMRDVYSRYYSVVSAMFEELKANGYFSATYHDSEYTETRTPDLTHTRTPDLTDSHIPNVSTTSEASQVYSNTPDSSGVISGSYASEVTKNNSKVTSSGADTRYTTGNETTKETGTETRTYTLTKGLPHGSVWDLLKEEKRSLIDTVLSYYAPCFILLY